MMNIACGNYSLAAGQQQYQSLNRSEKSTPNSAFKTKMSGEEHYIKAKPDGRWTTCAEVDRIPSKYALKSERAFVWGWYEPGIEYRLFHAAESTEENPVVIVRGVDEHQKLFEERIDVRNINPHNTSVLELNVLQGFNPKGYQGFGYWRMDAPGFRERFDYLTGVQEAIEDYKSARCFDDVASRQEEMEFILDYTGNRALLDRKGVSLEHYAKEMKRNLELYSQAARERMIASMSARCSEELSDLFWEK